MGASSKKTGISADTPPLSEAERAQKKLEKKARKEARRAAAAAEAEVAETAVVAAADVQELTGEEKAAAKAARKAEKRAKKDNDKKRKAEELDEPEESAVVEAATTEPVAAPVASTSTLTPSEVSEFVTKNRITYEPPEAGLEQFKPVLSFAALPLDGSLRKGLSQYTTPTPIQSASFPIMMGGKDVIGIAETGSGKTVAFGVPALQHILSLPAPKKGKTGPVSVLVVAPTRELAMQTHTNLAAVAGPISTITSLCIYGGVSKDDQKKALRQQGPRIVVGTPGRLLDLAGEGALDLSQVSWLVLDEADRMLDKGFENDIREIIKQCLPLPKAPLGPIGAAGTASAPTARMTCMFSATWPTTVRKLAADFMCQPVRIIVGTDELTANSRVEQSCIVFEDTRKKEAKLLDVLRQHGFTPSARGGKKNGAGEGKERDKVLVFALYKKEATRVTEFLERSGYEVGCIQGDMTQERRSKSLADFKDGKVNVLVATDVAARGLDIPKVELVVNQTFPLTIEDYIHRIGRTGRAGRKGKSVTFFGEPDKAHAGQLIRVLKDGGHPVPEGLYQWGTTIKKASHSTYGAHFRDDIKGTAKKIKFD